MSTHLRYADEPTVVHCPETEDNHSIIDLAATYEADGYGCTGCRTELELPVPLAHHNYTVEDWNCNGLQAEVEQGVCLGCGELIGETE